MIKSELTIKDFFGLDSQSQASIFTEIVSIARLHLIDGDSANVCMNKAKKATGYQKAVVQFCVRSDSGFVNAVNAKRKLNHRFITASEMRIL